MCISAFSYLWFKQSFLCAHTKCTQVLYIYYQTENKEKEARHWSLSLGLFSCMFIFFTSQHLASTSQVPSPLHPILSPLLLSKQPPPPITLCSSLCLPARTLRPHSLAQYKQNYKCAKHVVQVPINPQPCFSSLPLCCGLQCVQNCVSLLFVSGFAILFVLLFSHNT